MSANDIGPRIGIEGEKAFKQSITAVNAQLRALTAEGKALEAQFAGNEKSEEALAAQNALMARSVDAVKQKMSVLDKELAGQKEKLSALGTALEETKREFGENSEQALAAQNAYNRQATTVNNLERQYQDATRQLHELNNAMNDAGDSADDAGDRLNSGDILAANAAWDMIKSAVSAAANALRDCIQTSMEFDSAMSDVAATMGTTADQLGNLREFAQEMGATTAFTAAQSAQALNYMALAGYDAEEAMEALPSVLNLAAAGGVELSSASDMVTDAQSALGLSMEETARLVDEMAMTSTRTNTSVAQLGEAILTVGGTAKFLSGGTQELNQVLGLLADNSIKGAEGGTKLRNIILSLSAPTEKAAAQLAQLGVSVFDAEGNMRRFSEVFPELQSALSSLTDQGQLEALNEIFNSRDIAAAQALLGTTAERWAEVDEAIQGAAGSAEQMAETRMDNLAGDITKLQSAADVAKIALVDSLTPALRGLTQAGTGILTFVTGAIKQFPILGNVLAGAAASLAVLTLGAGASAVGITSLTGAVTALTGAVAASPIGPFAIAIGVAVTALTALSGAIKKASKDTEELAEGAEDLAESMDGSTESAGDAADSQEELAKSLEETAQTAAGSQPALEDLIAATGELEETTQTLIGASNTLTDVLKEQAEGGSLSLKTTNELIDAGYAAAISIDTETGAVTVDRDAYAALTKIKIEDQLASLESQRQSAVNAECLAEERIAVLGTKDAYWEAAAAKLAAASDNVKALDAQIAALKHAQSAAVSYSGVSTKASRRSSSAAKKIKSQAEMDLEAFKAAKAELDHLKAMDLEDEASYYQRLGNLRDQYLTDDGNLDQYRKISEQIHKYEQGLLEDRTKLREDFAKRAKETNDQMLSLEEDYQKQLTSRVQEIYGSYKLFEEIPERQKVSGAQLIRNLREQTQAIQSFYDDLTALEERGASREMVSEIRSMGVGASDQLSALLKMSDKQLTEYSELYGEKQKTANAIAMEELERLRLDTDAKIQQCLDDVKALYDQNAPALGQSFAEGLANGIKDNIHVVMAAAMEAGMAAEAGVRSATDMHSPSRVAEELGLLFDQGYRNGLAAGMPMIRRDVEAMMTFSNPRVSAGEIGNLLAEAVNALNTSADTGAPQPLHITIQTEDKLTIARAFVPDIRTASRENPMVEDDP